MKRLPVTIHLDAALKSWLDAEATRRHCSISQVLRDLIVEKLNK
jgi:hypothetical protein